MDTFIPNDTYIADGSRVALITGANCSGKSVYLKQVSRDEGMVRERSRKRATSPSAARSRPKGFSPRWRLLLPRQSRTILGPFVSLHYCLLLGHEACCGSARHFVTESKFDACPW